MRVKNYVVSYPCIYIKKGQVSTGFTRLPGFRQANSSTGFYLNPNRSQALVGQVPGQPAGPVRVSKLCLTVPAAVGDISKANLVATLSPDLANYSSFSSRYRPSSPPPAATPLSHLFLLLSAQYME
jgi:hypothetical protein